MLPRTMSSAAKPGRATQAQAKASDASRRALRNRGMVSSWQVPRRYWHGDREATARRVRRRDVGHGAARAAPARVRAAPYEAGSTGENPPYCAVSGKKNGL